MTRVAVLGDSRVGKTEFMHLATTGHVPLNVFSSRAVERFYLQGTCSAAEFVVVPGHASDSEAQEAVHNADALLVIYSHSTLSARKWITRCTQGRPTTLPILVCAHGTKVQPSAARVADLLRHYPSAEHTETSPLLVTGLIDCANRIVMRARKELGSPL